MTSVPIVRGEGWALAKANGRAHYFRGARTLCGIAASGRTTLQHEPRQLPGDCSTCWRALRASREAVK